MLKTLDEIEQAIDLMLQDIDLSKQNLSKNLLKNQFKQALDRIGGLERTLQRMRIETESCSECNSRQFKQSLLTYMDYLK